MDVQEFVKRFDQLSDVRKYYFIAEIYGRLIALKRIDILTDALKEYEQKN